MNDGDFFAKRKMCMTKESIIDIIKDKVRTFKESSFDCGDDEMYMIYKINDDYCFLYFDGQILFCQKNLIEAFTRKISTDFFILETNINVKIKSGKSFWEEKYNLIWFNKNISHDSDEFNIYADLCLQYTEQTTYSIYDFFDILSKLFKEHKDFNDLIGLYGELVFIEYCLQNKIWIWNGWHSDVKSKYDFFYKNLIFEVKTSCSTDNKFLIKHKQIFNDEHPYLVAVHLSENNSGLAIKKLVDTLLEKIDDTKFRFKLTNEISKIKNDKSLTKKVFVVDWIRIFDSKTLNLIKIESPNVSDLTYEWEPDKKQENIDISEIFK